jgi:hypothetical protein
LSWILKLSAALTASGTSWNVGAFDSDFLVRIIVVFVFVFVFVVCVCVCVLVIVIIAVIALVPSDRLC